MLTPTPTIIPTPTAQVSAPTDLEVLFNEFANQYAVDANYLKSIADCEAHFNNAVLVDDYAGMYQFTTSTWIHYRNLMSKDPNPNLRFGKRESIETAAFVVSIGKSGIWPSCN